MTYRELVKEYIKKENGDFSEGTLKLYSLKLTQLNKDLNNDNNFNDKFELLNDYNQVFEYIKQFNTDNSLAFLNASICILKDKKLLKIYKEKREEYSDVKKEKYLNNIKSNNFIDYQELLSKTEIDNFDNLTLKEGIPKFMLYMVVRYPIRLELYNLPIMRVKKNMDENKNYLYITARKIEIIMNSFKNVKSFGKTIISIEKEDEKVIREYLKFLTRNEIKHSNLLLNYYSGVDTFNSVESYFRVLKKLLKKTFNKDITTNDIRQSYETKLMNSEEYKTMTNLEKTKLHNRLLHNMESAFKNYNKV